MMAELPGPDTLSSGGTREMSPTSGMSDGADLLLKCWVNHGNNGAVDGIAPLKAD
jgi:hypothetical protein